MSEVDREDAKDIIRRALLGGWTYDKGMEKTGLSFEAIAELVEEIRSEADDE